MKPRHNSRCLFLSVLFLCALAVSPALAQDGFTPLFNGKDLGGWVPVGTPDAFMVEKGAILSTGASPYPSWLRTDMPYENFILRFEYQTLGWYEGGILIHAPVDGPASKLGLQVHLRHDSLDYQARSPGAVYDVAAPKSLANFGSGKWNSCEILCDWPHLQVTLNGVKIQDLDMATNPSLRYRLRKGFVGLENIGCRAYFRNIAIKRLPGQEEWTSLFSNGLDGMYFLGDSRWKVSDDTLIGEGPTGYALTKAAFKGPFELQVWVKTCTNGNGGVTFNASGQSTGTEVQCFNCPDSTNPTGSLYDIAPADRIASQDGVWFLLQIFVDGPNAMVLVNGEKVSETDQLKPPYEGTVGFQQHTPGGHIEYRGARIRQIRWSFSLGASAAALPEIYSTQGRLILTQLVSAPFPHPQRADGREYKGQFFSAKEHYADSTVAIFIPRGFRETAQIDFVVHFHGWKNHVAEVLERYRLIKQFQESRRNALLVIPQGPCDAPDSFGGKLEDPGGFRRFMDEVMTTLEDKSAVTNRQSVLGNIILSGHSGGYQVISSILDHGGLSDRVGEVWLFDALYAQTDRFLTRFEKRHGRLVDLYTEHGGTKVETERLMGVFKQRGVSFYSGKEAEVTANELRQSGPIFLFSDLDHDAVLQENQAFRRFLESSRLEELHPQGRE